tara:strand:- start:231 stop:407 length:177 start_codon:yes stop_codon:yes gene_type:complete
MNNKFVISAKGINFRAINLALSQDLLIALNDGFIIFYKTASCVIFSMLKNLFYNSKNL